MRLIERMGSISIPNQKRILCMNKVDLVEKKKDLLKVVEEFNDLSGYERYAILFLCLSTILQWVLIRALTIL